MERRTIEGRGYDGGGQAPVAVAENRFGLPSGPDNAAPGDAKSKLERPFAFATAETFMPQDRQTGLFITLPPVS